MDEAPLMEDTLSLLRELIQERTGLFFRDGEGLTTIAHRLAPVIEKTGAASIHAFYELLNGSENTVSPEWRDTLTALTKQASNFSRHKPYLQVLTNSVLPKILANGARKPLKIWSAGCSTGEEPLAIAVALNEGGWFDRAGIEIHGTDGSVTAIETACRGIYGKYRVGLSYELRDKYFLPVDGEFQIMPALHKRVRWAITNLADENEIAAFADADIIFCRNVFIYFSDTAIVKTLRSFAKYMPVGGYLFTDSGDHFNSLVEQTGFFETQDINGIPVRIRREHVP